MNWNGDYLTLGPVPCDEDCAQVGSRDFRNQSRREMKAYINQLKREFPEWVGHDVAFKIMSFAHDFGSYGEVVIEWNMDCEKAQSFAIHVENNLPMNWDSEALEELDDSF